MATFNYEGRTASGDVRKGTVDAPDANAARAKVQREQRLASVQVTEAKGFQLDLGGLLAPKVALRDIVIFSRQFATMIDSGLPLVQCLEIQSTQAENPTMRKQLSDIKNKVEGGSTFADALKGYPDTFDDLYVNLVAAGEVGGMLDEIMNRLASYLEKNQKLIRQVKSAMTYPVIVLLVAGVVISLLLLKVVPTFEDMFADFGSALPAPTQIVLDMSKWLQANWWICALIIGGSVTALQRIYQTPTGRLALDGMLLKAPVIGDVVSKVAVARFCRTLGTMISSGVPILEALAICGRTSGNKVIERAIDGVTTAISEGRPMSEPLTEAKIFPSMVCQMISVGEATGALDTMLTKIADFYDEEVDTAVEGMTSALEPMIMAFLGVAVGGLVIAMYMPIFEMAGKVG